MDNRFREGARGELGAISSWEIKQSCRHDSLTLCVIDECWHAKQGEFPIQECGGFVLQVAVGFKDHSPAAEFTTTGEIPEL